MYDIISLKKNKAINSDVDELSLQFRTVQPSGLLFHARGSGGDFADYVTLEIVGARLRFVHVFDDEMLFKLIISR